MLSSAFPKKNPTAHSSGLSNDTARASATTLLDSRLSLWLDVKLWWTSRQELRDAAGRLQGARVDRGLIAEQFAPFTRRFEELGWGPQEFKFLGRPVDEVQFQEDEVIIVEFRPAVRR